MRLKREIICVILFLFSGFVWAAQSPDPDELSQGQVIYIPAYSHVYFGNSEREFNLSCTLMFHNVNPDVAITLDQVRYYDSQGELVREYLNSPRTIKPMQTVWFIVRESDRSGGAGANFTVRWHADSRVIPPISETVNIGTAFGQGISFVKDGVVIEEIK